ncbi:MAG TPA: flagellar hook-length control protein FliK [Candidatus Nanopelagicaceae bacterium]|nr:flagellar hook-length control protein FliK [Candidatus Nanopelagicaceae bacterium]
MRVDPTPIASEPLESHREEPSDPTMAFLALLGQFLPTQAVPIDRTTAVESDSLKKSLTLKSALPKSVTPGLALAGEVAKVIGAVGTKVFPAPDLAGHVLPKLVSVESPLTAAVGIDPKPSSAELGLAVKLANLGSNVDIGTAPRVNAVGKIGVVANSIVLDKTATSSLPRQVAKSQPPTITPVLTELDKASGSPIEVAGPELSVKVIAPNRPEKLKLAEGQNTLPKISPITIKPSRSPALATFTPLSQLGSAGTAGGRQAILDPLAEAHLASIKPNSAGAVPSGIILNQAAALTVAAPTQPAAPDNRGISLSTISAIGPVALPHGTVIPVERPSDRGPTGKDAGGSLANATTGAEQAQLQPPAIGAVLAPAAPQAPVSVAAQLAPQVASLTSGPDGTHQITVLLHPADLGQVQVVVELKDGTINLQLAGSHDPAREALIGALPDLRRELIDAGLSVGRTDVLSQNLGTSGGSMTGGYLGSGNQSAPGNWNTRSTPLPAPQLMSDLPRSEPLPSHRRVSHAGAVDVTI